MKLVDIVFHPADCCGQHLSATVELPGGRALGLIKGSDDRYAVAHYQDGALVRREADVGAETVELIINR